MQVLINLLGAPNTGAQGAQGGAPGTPGTGSGGLLGESPGDMGDDMLRNIRFEIGRRDVGADNQRFAPFPAATAPGLNGGNGNVNGGGGSMNLAISNGRLLLTGVQQLDGEYVVLVPADGLIAQQGPQGPQPIQKGASSVASALGVGIGHLISFAGALLALVMI